MVRVPVRLWQPWLGEAGFRVAIYDPIFFPDESVLAERYDFITCTETAEHFRDPGTQFGRLNGLLRSPGWLGVRTAMLDDWSGFPDWYYHRDPTHISFYSQRTMRWIAEQYGWGAGIPPPERGDLQEALGPIAMSEVISTGW